MTMPHQPTPEPEDALRRRFHAGEPDAIDTLATLFFADLARFSRSLTGDEDHAMEAVQETFLRVLERHALYRPERPFRPWLFAVCRNCCLGILRRRSREGARVIDMEPGDEEIARLAADVPPVFEDMVRREREQEALDALACLPEATRSIVLLHLFEGMTFREVADIVGRPAPTIATIYYRAMRELKDRLTADAERRQTHGG